MRCTYNAPAEQERTRMAPLSTEQSCIKAFSVAVANLFGILIFLLLFIFYNESVSVFDVFSFNSPPASAKAFLPEISRRFIPLPGVEGETYNRVK